MPQELTEDLLDILESRFQAAARGFRGRVEMDYTIQGPEGGGEEGAGILEQYKVVSHPGVLTVTLDTPPVPGRLGLLAVGHRDEGGVGPLPSFIAGWQQVPQEGPDAVVYAEGGTSGGYGHADMWYREWQVGDTGVNVGSDCEKILMEWSGLGTVPIDAAKADASGQTGPDLSMTSGAPGARAMVIGAGINRLQSSGDVTATGDTQRVPIPPDPLPTTGVDHDRLFVLYEESPAGAAVELTATLSGGSLGSSYPWGMRVVAFEVLESDVRGTLHLQPKRISLDKSRRLTASQATVEVPNETGQIDTSADGLVQSHHPIRIYQWYGDPANEIRTFTGFVDVVREGRDPRTITLTCRDTMKRLIVQNFSAIGPQGADEDDTVRTEANGVFLERDADYIVTAILDLAGWPSDERDIAPTGYALDEYVIPDGSTWAEAIVGDNALTGLTGYDAWADELGVFHFRPQLATAAPDSDTDPTPDYSYIVSDRDADNLTSANIIRLDREVDDYDLKTRVKVRGNLSAAQAAWTEVWHTNKFNKPVGLWYDPSDSNFLKVLDRGTKKIYRLRQSDREKVGVGIWPLDISGDVNHPLGLSGDPADSDRFWVLDAAWRTSAGNNASIHKYDASSGAHLAEYSLPDGQWSDLKVSSSFIWVTNYGTNKLHKRSKTDGTNITTYNGPTVNGNVQTNPTGVAVDGTTLLTFWDGKARFLLTDESAPETLDPSTPLLDGNGIIRTAGSKVFGGEMDTTTDAHLYACHDELGLVWKFALTEPTTDEVFSEVVDTDLEDALGFLADAEPREHDTHPGDADHAYEIRRETLTLEKTITNLAQATETALRVLDELAHRREVNDWAVVGHPGHQRGDLHQLTDPVQGVDALYILDTYRDNMDERGYFATIAYVPYDPEY